VTNPPVVNGSANQVTLQADQAQSFFRLRKD